MPSKPGKICSCGQRVPAGAKCSCQREAERAHDAKRGTAAQRGYDGKWRQQRLLFLAANPSCRRCGEPATIVDHIAPHRGDFTKGGLFWSRRNWQPLCKPCHDGAKQSEERAAQKDGRP